MTVNKLLKKFIIVSLVVMFLYFLLSFFLAFIIKKSREEAEKFVQEANKNVQEETKKQNVFGLKHMDDSNVPNKSPELKKLEKDLDNLSDMINTLDIDKEINEELTQNDSNKDSKKVLGNAPNIITRDIYGKEFNLSNFYGNVIILDFFATWCPPCMKEIPHFVSLLNKYENKGVKIIGVSFDENEEVVKKFKDINNISYPIIMANEKIIKDYRLGNAIPETFVINKEGNIVKRYVGFQDKNTFENDINDFI